MSAFIINKSHINAMVTLAMNERLTWYHNGQHHEFKAGNANQVGQMLLDECVHAVSCRYPDDTIASLPGMANAEWIIPFVWVPLCRIPTPVEAIKLIHCYHYQSIEDREFDTTEAAAFCESLEATMINKLPGYEEASWEWEDSRYYEKHNIKRLV